MDAKEYAKYLKSDQWKETRKKALERGGHKRALCARTDHLQVHHNDYSSIGEELLTDLVVLCSSCHAKHHGI